MRHRTLIGLDVRPILRRQPLSHSNYWKRVSAALFLAGLFVGWTWCWMLGS